MVIIGDDVWIAAVPAQLSYALPGWCVLAGVPARVIGERPGASSDHGDEQHARLTAE